MHTCIHTCIMTRVISISDEAYDRLKSIKKENMSFSKVIIGLTETERRKRFFEFVKNMEPDEELARNVEEVYKQRGRFRLRRVTL